jgi:putative redox protein
MRIDLEQVDDAFNFKAMDENGHSVMMDAGVDIGGHNNGVRPMQMLLMGLGGCAAIDIVLILKKQRQEVDSFKISIDGERETGKDINLWKEVKLHFKLKGKIDLKKAERAVSLSVEKYCSVSKTLEMAGANISFHVSVND